MYIAAYANGKDVNDFLPWLSNEGIVCGEKLILTAGDGWEYTVNHTYALNASGCQMVAPVKHNHKVEVYRLAAETPLLWWFAKNVKMHDDERQKFVALAVKQERYEELADEWERRKKSTRPRFPESGKEHQMPVELTPVSRLKVTRFKPTGNLTWREQKITKIHTEVDITSTVIPHSVEMIRKFRAMGRDLPPPKNVETRTERYVRAVEYNDLTVPEVTGTVEYVDRNIERKYLASWDKWFPVTPYSQQIIGAQAIYECGRVALWYTMRTGKTLTALAAGRRLLAEGKIERIVVICTSSGRFDPWKEWAQQARLSVAIPNGSIEQDAEVMRQVVDDNYNLVAINYERLDSRLELLRDYIDPRNCMIIFDETGYVKTPDSARSQACYDFALGAEYIVLLNGTPTEEGPHHAFSQLRLIFPGGANIGLNFSDFAQRYLRLVGMKYEVRRDAAADFKSMFERTGLRLTSGESDQYSTTGTVHRFIALRPTQDIIDNYKLVADGLQREADGSIGKNVERDKILPIMMALHELCNGTNKRKEPNGNFVRTPHTVDPKIAWLECFLASTNDPVVVAVEFSNQESRIKHMLNRCGIRWAGTSDIGGKVVEEKVSSAVEPLLFSRIDEVREYLDDIYDNNPDGHAYDRDFAWEGPECFRCHPYVIDWFSANEPHLVVTEEYDKSGKKFSAQRRADEMRRFRQGDARVFILKTCENRGMTLKRAEAVARGITGWPVIISLSPHWTLADWNQLWLRCQGDREAGKQVNTRCFALYVEGSLEAKILAALRRKEDFSIDTLSDRDRKGFGSFVESMITDMKNGSLFGGDLFDTEELSARSMCGISPFARLTKNLIKNKVREKYGQSWKDIDGLGYYVEYLNNKIEE